MTERKMSENVFYMVPSGGLANRMRAVASAYWLQQQTGSRTQVIWFCDWALNAPFHQLFLPITKVELSLRDATLLDHLLYDRARRRNLWLPALPQRLLFSRRMNESEVKPLKLSGFDFVAWAKGHRCYMSNFMHFGDWQPSLYQQLFTPVKEVTDKVDSLRQQFSPHTIGMHIRRGDNQYCIANSPLQLYIDKVAEEVERHDDTKVFLATDSQDVKKEMRSRYGQRIITVDDEADRGSVEGIRGGLVDLYTLSSTSRVYGSLGSTYVVMAADLGGIEMIDLHR